MKCAKVGSVTEDLDQRVRDAEEELRREGLRCDNLKTKFLKLSQILQNNLNKTLMISVGES